MNTISSTSSSSLIITYSAKKHINHEIPVAWIRHAQIAVFQSNILLFESEESLESIVKAAIQIVHEQFTLDFLRQLLKNSEIIFRLECPVFLMFPSVCEVVLELLNH